MKKIAIIGGGIAGLTAAFELRDSDYEITIFEPKRLGGKVFTEKRDGLLIEHGPDAISGTHPVTEEIIKELGLQDQVIQPFRSHFTYVIKRTCHQIPLNTLRPYPGSLRSIWSLPFISFRGKVSASLRPIITSRKPGKDQSLEEFLSKRYGSELGIKLLAPLYSGIYGGQPNEISASVLPKHRNILLKKAPFITFKDGMQTLVDALIKNVKHCKVIKEKVISIVPEIRRLTVSTENYKESFNKVIIAVPSKEVTSILDDVNLEASYYLKKLKYGTSSVFTMVSKSGELSHLGTGAIYSERSDGITGLTISSIKWQGRTENNEILIRVFATGNPTVKNVKQKLRKVDPINSYHHLCTDTWNTVPIYTIDRKYNVSKAREFLEKSNIYLVGSGYDGAGIPDTIASAKRIVEDILDD